MKKIILLIPKNGEKIYLNIEIISGNILIRTNTTDEYYQNGNKRLYILIFVNIWGC